MSDIARSIREREQAFEAQYKLHEEQNFKIRARRDRLFGEWVAGQLNLCGRDARRYALDAAMMDLDAPGDGNLISKAISDLQGAGKDVTNTVLLDALSEAMNKSVASMRGEFPEALDTDHHA